MIEEVLPQLRILLNPITMSDSQPIPDLQTIPEPTGAEAPTPTSPEPPPSYVKLAMRNMVRKGGKSLFHFALTASGLLLLLVGLAYLTR